jgi:IS5 family transposase
VTPGDLHDVKEKGIESAIIPKANCNARSIKENARRPRIKKAMVSRRQTGKKYKELKNDRGLARCRCYHLTKTSIQAFLTATSVNLKRMVKLIFYPRKTWPTFYYIPAGARKLLHIRG